MLILYKCKIWILKCSSYFLPNDGSKKLFSVDAAMPVGCMLHLVMVGYTVMEATLRVVLQQKAAIWTLKAKNVGGRMNVEDSSKELFEPSLFSNLPFALAWGWLFLKRGKSQKFKNTAQCLFALLKTKFAANNPTFCKRAFYFSVGQGPSHKKDLTGQSY